MSPLPRLRRRAPRERLETGEDIVIVEGRFQDDSRFEGANCVTIAGR